MSAVQRLFSIVPQAIQGTTWLFVAFFFGSIAETLHASCGDYLHGTAVQTRSLHPQDFGASESRTFQPFHEETRFSPQPASSTPRCHGPLCQRAPVAPFDRPQPDHQRTSLKEFCFWDGMKILHHEEWHSLTLTSDVAPETPDTMRLDRPPQVAFARNRSLFF